MRRITILALSLCLLFLNCTTSSASVFSDVASDHPYFTAINYLHENGVIEGYEDNTFRPDQKVNRVEALKIILLGSDIFVPEIQEQEIFPDVMHGTWYAKYVIKAKNLTIVKGDDNTGLFRPGDTVNLAEALKILLKTNSEEGISPAYHPYSDVPPNAWFAPYFEYSRLAGLLDQSSSENVYPATPVTRGLLAELMYRLDNSNYLAADGKASYYGEKFHGKTTASGEIFDASAFTAAHLSYPFGTRLKVTNVENNKSVVVRINDRGPYVSDPTRILDLSKASFEYIASLSRGIIQIKIETTFDPITTTAESAPLTNLIKGDLLNPTKTNCPEAETLQYIGKSTFDSITLDREIPTRVVLDEVLTLKGTTSSNADTVSAFIVDSDDSQTAFEGIVGGSNRFAINVRFPNEGTYKLGILPGQSGSSVIKEIKVLKNTCIEEVENIQLTSVPDLDIDTIEGDTIISWHRGNYNLFKLTFSQGGLHKSYILYNLDEWKPVYKEFASFTPSNAELSLRGGVLDDKSILDPVQIQWSPASKLTFMASTHYEYNVNDEEVELISLTKNTIIGNVIKVVFEPRVSVRAKAAVILPNGKVKEITLTSPVLNPETNQFDVEVFSASDESLTASYEAEQTGIHFLEINNADGLAAINVPIYVRNQFPLVPSVRDLADDVPVDLGNNLAGLRTQLLSLLNHDRDEHNLSSLTIDNSLNNLAQSRSDDMVANNYFGHWDKQGLSANDLRLNYGIQTQVGENLAKDINLELAQYGLMRSAVHRSNIISDEWTRVGFGISKESEGTYIVVQIFSTDPLDMDDLDGLRNEILESANANRTIDLTLQSNLNTVAQNWSQKMADEDFFDFTDGSGNSLVDTIRDAGIVASLGTYIMGNSSFSDALGQISQNIQIQESKWKKFGVGIKQDNLGIIKITLIYTE